MHEELSAELLRRAARDQEARREKGSSAGMARVDGENLPWLEKVVDEVRWPTSAMVGEQASHAAWLLVQHADRDPAFQRRCLDLLTAAAAQGQAAWRDVAYLTDRVLLAEGRQQEYGTQVVGRSGRWIPRDLREPESVDERRSAVGLQPLADYLALFDDRGSAALDCPGCGTPIRFWEQEPGEQVQVVCPGCGRTTTVEFGGRRRPGPS